MIDQLASFRHYGHSIFVSDIVLIIITGIALVARLYAKYTTKARFGWDDLMIVIAHIFFYATVSVTMYATTLKGAGKSYFNQDFLDFSKVSSLSSTLALAGTN
jgi:hypothetical protein